MPKKPNSCPVVLVVDHAIARSRKMADKLEASGLRAILCDQPLKALGLIRRELPNAVVLEVVMPNRSGFEIAARMQADPALWKIPIIFTSDIQDSAASNHDYFPRPVDMAKLVATLKERIEGES